MKKIMLIFVVLLAILATTSVYASKKTEIIYEKEIALISTIVSFPRHIQVSKVVIVGQVCMKFYNISTKASTTWYTQVSKVEIDGQLYMKEYNIFLPKNNEFVEHVVKYTDQTTGIIWKEIRWHVKNGKVSFPKGQNPVRIVTVY